MRPGDPPTLDNATQYLKEQLFTCLRLYHRNNTDTVRHYESLSTAHILMTKGHYNYAQEILEKLEQDTLKNEKHLPYIASQDFLSACLSFQNSRDIHTVQKTIDCYENALQQIELLKAYMSVRLTYKKITNIVYAPQYNQDSEVALKKILAEELENKKLSDIDDIATKYYYLQCKSVIYSNIGKDIFERIKVLEQLLVVVHLAMEKGIFMPGEQWVVLVNLAGLYTDTANKEKFYNTIQKLDDTLVHFDNQRKNNVLYWKYTRLCEFYYNFPDEKPFDNLFETIEKWLENTEYPINEKNKTGLMFAIARYYFILGNYHTALEQLNTFLLKKEIDIDDFYFLYIKGLYIICQYELKVYAVAQKELLALKRKLRRNKLATAKVKKLLRHLTSIVNIESQNYDLNKYFQKIIEIFENDVEQELQNRVLGFVLKWAETKNNI